MKVWDNGVYIFRSLVLIFLWGQCRDGCRTAVIHSDKKAQSIRRCDDVAGNEIYVETFRVSQLIIAFELKWYRDNYKSLNRSSANVLLNAGLILLLGSSWIVNTAESCTTPVDHPSVKYVNDLYCSVLKINRRFSNVTHSWFFISGFIFKLSQRKTCKSDSCGWLFQVLSLSLFWFECYYEAICVLRKQNVRNVFVKTLNSSSSTSFCPFFNI